MPNEIRPCTLWEETFDACDFTGEVAFITKDVSANIHQDLRYYARFFTKDVRVSYTTPLHRYKTELSQYVNKVNYTIHQALNAPVLATKEVLAGLPKDANFLVNVKNDSYMDCWVQAVFEDYGGYYDRKNAMKWIRNQEWVIEYAKFAEECGDRDYILEISLKELLIEGDPVYIKSNECSKTAEYLRQFTLQGVRIKEGG